METTPTQRNLGILVTEDSREVEYSHAQTLYASKEETNWAIPSKIAAHMEAHNTEQDAQD